MAARSYWTNPLPWRDEEDRGELVPLLHNLTGATSFRLATAERDGTSDVWDICFDYAFEQELFTIWRHWCTRSDDPEPPPHPKWISFGCCPGHVYPEQMSGSVFTEVNPLCTCSPLTFFSLNEDGALGPWGGWSGTVETCEDTTLEVGVYPTECIEGGMRWRLKLTWDGGDLTSDIDVTCGTGLWFSLNAPPFGDGCILQISFSVSWPWALPA